MEHLHSSDLDLYRLLVERCHKETLNKTLIVGIVDLHLRRNSSASFELVLELCLESLHFEYSRFHRLY